MLLGRRNARVLLIVLAAMTAFLASSASSAQAIESSWFTNFSAGPLNSDGSPSEAAASRPYGSR